MTNASIDPKLVERWAREASPETHTGYHFPNRAALAKVCELAAAHGAAQAHPVVNIPPEGSEQSDHAIKVMFEQRDWPVAPMNAARAGWHAARLYAAQASAVARGAELDAQIDPAIAHYNDELEQPRAVELPEPVNTNDRINTAARQLPEEVKELLRTLPGLTSYLAGHKFARGVVLNNLSKEVERWEIALDKFSLWLRGVLATQTPKGLVQEIENTVCRYAGQGSVAAGGTLEGLSVELADQVHQLLAAERQKIEQLESELDKAQDEINCTEASLEAFSCEFTDEVFNQGFDCLGHFADALHTAYKEERQKVDSVLTLAREALWMCAEHAALHFSKRHNTAIQANAAIAAIDKHREGA